MSNVVKCACVAYSSEPREAASIGNISNHSGTTEKIENMRASDIGFLLSRNAMESADVSLKAAADKVESIKAQARIEMQAAMNEAALVGAEYGLADGRRKGDENGTESGRQAIRDAAYNFTARMNALNAETADREAAIRKECVEFAFGLAENVLNINIDRNRPEYRAIFEEYLSIKPRDAVLSVDGAEYPFTYIDRQTIEACFEGIEAVSITFIGEENGGDEAEQTQADLPEEPVPATDNAAADTENRDAEVEPQEDNSAAEYEQPAAVPPKEENETENAAEWPQTVPIPKEQEEVSADASDDGEEENHESQEDDEPDTGAENIPAEKFVFVHPAIRTARVKSTARQYTFEDMAEIDSGRLKQFLRKADQRLLAASLAGTGDDDEVLKAVFNACTRKAKEKLVDGIRYLGPISAEDTGKARNELAEALDQFMKDAGDGE